MKRKVFGLDGAAAYGIEAPREDTVASLRRSHRAERDPSFASWGPRTRRELFALDEG